MTNQGRRRRTDQIYIRDGGVWFSVSIVLAPWILKINSNSPGFSAEHELNDSFLRYATDGLLRCS
jgi:hypothetical protein